MIDLATMQLNCVIESKHLCLKPMDKKYLDFYIKWLNDPEINSHLGPIIGSLFTREKGEEWYDNMKSQGNRRIFTLHPKEEGAEPIGYCGLYRIDHRHNRATIQVIIGEEEYRGKGLGTETTELLLDYGFSALSLNTISLSFMEINEKARKVSEKIGFHRAGRLRDYWKVDGEYCDRVLMDITREEFYDEKEQRLADACFQAG